MEKSKCTSHRTPPRYVSWSPYEVPGECSPRRTHSGLLPNYKVNMFPLSQMIFIYPLGTRPQSLTHVIKAANQLSGGKGIIHYQSWGLIWVSNLGVGADGWGKTGEGFCSTALVSRSVHSSLSNCSLTFDGERTHGSPPLTLNLAEQGRQSGGKGD